MNGFSCGNHGCDIDRYFYRGDLLVEYVFRPLEKEAIRHDFRNV